MADINHPVRNALLVLGIGDDPAVRSLYYRWAGFMADVRWERGHPKVEAHQMRRDLLRHFNDDRVEMSRQMEILRGHVFAAIDHAKVEGAKKRSEQAAQKAGFLSLLEVRDPTYVFNVDTPYHDGFVFQSHRYQK